MPVNGGWDSGLEQVYVLNCEGLWTWEQFERGVDAAYTLLATQPGDVDFIMNFAGEIPPGDAMKRLTYAGEQPTNVRHTVVINANNVLMRMIFNKVDKQKGWDGPAFVPSIEDARTELKKLRSRNRN